MTVDKTRRAYQSYATILELVEKHGEDVDPRLVLDALDDVTFAYLGSSESMNMIRTMLHAVKYGELDRDSRKELQNTVEYLNEP